MRLLAALMLLVAGHVHAGSINHSLGIARDADTLNVRYIEHHQYMADGQHFVDYYTPDLQRFAYKRLTYPGLPQHPEIEQEDFNRDSYASVKLGEDEIQMTRRAGNEDSSGSVPLDEALVVDAGFDAYVKANWDTLLDVRETDLKFAVAGLPRTLTMRVERLPSNEDERVVFRIYPRNWFVRIFLPSLDLWYTPDRQLLRYAGYSNLLPRDGEGRQVVIDFTHHETETVLDAPKMEWIAKRG